MSQLGNLPASGSFHTGAAQRSDSIPAFDQVEGKPHGATDVAKQVAQTRGAVKPDPKSASMLETAADLSKSLGMILGYGLAVTVAISLLPESLLLALIVSFKGQVKGEDVTAPGEAADDTDTDADNATDTDDGSDWETGIAAASPGLETARVSDYQVTESPEDDRQTGTIVSLPSYDSDRAPDESEKEADLEVVEGATNPPAGDTVSVEEALLKTAVRNELRQEQLQGTGASAAASGMGTPGSSKSN